MRLNANRLIGCGPDDDALIVRDMAHILQYNRFPSIIAIDDVRFSEVDESTVKLFADALANSSSRDPRITLVCRNLVNFSSSAFLLEKYFGQPFSGEIISVGTEQKELSLLLKVIENVSLRSLILPVQVVSLISQETRCFIDACARSKNLVSEFSPPVFSDLMK